MDPIRAGLESKGQTVCTTQIVDTKLTKSVAEDVEGAGKDRDLNTHVELVTDALGSSREYRRREGAAKASIGKNSPNNESVKRNISEHTGRFGPTLKVTFS